MIRKLAWMPLVLALAGVSQAADILFIAPSYIDNQFLFGVNQASPPTFTSRTLTDAHPVLAGLGMGISEVRRDGTNTGQFIDNQNFATGNMRSASVMNITIDGGLAVPDSAYGSAPEIALGAFGSWGGNGINLTSGLQSVRDVEVKRVRGLGIVNGGSYTQVAPYWYPGWHYTDTVIHNCWTGMFFWSDATTSYGTWYGLRDIGALFLQGAGNCQIHEIHIYGTRAAAWDEANGTRISYCTLADSTIGYFGDNGTGLAAIDHTKFQHNWSRCIYNDMDYLTVSNSTIDVQRETTAATNGTGDDAGEDITTTVGTSGTGGGSALNLTGCYGIENYGEGLRVDKSNVIRLDSYVHGSFTASGGGSTAVVIGSGSDNCTFECPVWDNDGIAGSKGYHVKAAVENLKIDSEMENGFQGSGDQYLIIDNGIVPVGMKIDLYVDGSTIMNLPTNRTQLNAKFEIHSGWKPVSGAGSSNRITLHDTNGVYADYDFVNEDY